MYSIPYMANIAEQTATKRPLGVTILCALGYIGSVLTVLAGIALLAFGGATSSLGVVGAILGGMGAIAGVMLLAIGILGFFISRGLCNLKKWAWNVTMILEGLSVISSLVSMNIAGIIIPAIILYYLYTQKEIFQ